MQIAMEDVIDVCEELDELVRDYFAKTEAPQDCPPLDMDWDFYVTLQRRDQLMLVTARDDKLLVGFLMYVIAPHPHHKGLVSATCDILATRLDRRRNGIASQLMHASELYFRHHSKVRMLIHGFRTCYRTKPLFSKLGFKLVEQAYMKRL